jgi:gliding motility-associated-like protein
VDNDLIFVDYYVDADGDGYGAGAASNLCSDPGAGYVTNSDDCDDAFVTYVDADGDGFGSTVIAPCGAYDNTDCNDNDPNLISVSPEVCNLFDDDCDGEVDEFVTTTFYADVDGDGFGDVNNSIQACELPVGYVSNSSDCDDLELTYVDADSDGYGSTSIDACGVYNNSDCDDTTAGINPAIAEICGNGIDEDCSGADFACVIFGCTDSLACNYDVTATDENGSCTYPAQSYLNCDGTCINDTDGDGVCNEIEVPGCTDVDACNYDVTATDENGSCTYPAQSYLNCDGTCINDTDGDGVCNEIEVAGCTDATACNYDATATDENGSCTYPTQSYLNCDGTCINDTDGDGVCNELEVPGCTDATACNYNVLATDENGSCTYPTQSYLNCDGTCIIDTDGDGVCNEIEVAGCTDANACNYDATATDENGSCTYPAQSYLNCDGTCINDTDGDGVCNEIEVVGCTDAAACNYDATATDENGSCTYPAQSYLNCDGTCINDTDGDGVCNELEVSGCTDATACNYDATATDENGSCTYPAQSYLNCDGTCINDTDGDGVCNEIEVPGCTDVTACNYNALATDDNGSCVLPVAEVCNQLDDNCDGFVDNGLVFVDYYLDQDGDGFGAGAAINTCANPGVGYTTDNSDCDDNAILYLDQDGDGFGDSTIVACGVYNAEDCNDANPQINPSITEICNLIDDNCDGQIDEGVQTAYYADVDGDGFGDLNALVMACTQPAGYVLNTLDCNDNLLTYLDVDQDGYGVGNPIACGAGNNTDCNDINANMNPGVIEVCNGIDDNCSGVADEGLLTNFYQDLDADTYGDPNNMIAACTQPAGFVLNNLDCNDVANWANPDGVEVCNGIDDNCNGAIDENVLLVYYADADGDSYGNPLDSLLSCAQPDAYIDNNLDCNDAVPTAYPGASEVYDAWDNNCDGLINEGFEFIPDAFSPNNDGDYDTFVIDRLMSQETVSFKVYNRWGALVYSADNYQNDWNGKSNVGAHSGEDLVVGTYYYEIELSFSKKNYSGYITLWR